MSMSRRDVVVSGAVAATVLGLNGPIAFISAATARELPEAGQGFSRIAVGDAELIMVYDGVNRRPIGDDFIKGVSGAEIKAALAAAGRDGDVIPITFTVPIVKVGGRTIMFDAGTGGQLAPTAGLFDGNLQAAGVTKDSVDTIIVTHFHPDHIFGLMAKDTNEQIYPNAQIIVPKAEIDYWTDPASVAAMPDGRKGLANRIGATLAKWENVVRIADGAEVAPGITAVSAYGHTPGQTAYRIASGASQAMVLGDVANVPALFVANPEWQVMFDMDGPMAVATRKRIFDMAIADGLLVTGYHFGFPGAGRLEKDGSGYAFVQAA
ncbi:MAG: MBL fold metallo-hydrolase [Hyphomicrobiaceae bacterium]